MSVGTDKAIMKLRENACKVSFSKSDLTLKHYFRLDMKKKRVKDYVRRDVKLDVGG